MLCLSAPVRRFAIALLVMLAAACTPRETLDFSEVEPPTSRDADVVIRPVGDSGMVELRAGQVLAVEMKSTFAWREASPPILLRRQETFGAPADRAGRDRGTTGGPTWQVFVYRALQPGEATVEFVEARPWEPDNITDRYALIVRVLPASD